MDLNKSYTSQELKGALLTPLTEKNRLHRLQKS